MKNKQPPFEITNTMVTLVSEISELIGRLSVHDPSATNPTLRRANRIRTIQGSLAIEQNTLSIEQVTAVLNGKQVLASPKDIAEVKNAYEIYERLEELSPYSLDDLLTAHAVMTRGLVEESGMFRTKPVGVVDQSGRVLHFGTLPQYVPDLVSELLDWVKNSDVHMLIRSCVFHYEFELIHPFADGNGRLGRLWHTLLLSQWNPAFAWLPVESMIYAHQEEYYAAINFSNDAAESTVFVEFMLSTIKASLTDALCMRDEMSAARPDKSAIRWQIITQFLQSHVHIIVSTRTISADGFSVKKLCELDRRENVPAWRIHWARLLNAAYIKAGLPVRVHSKSFKKRGKTDREPLPYLSVADYQKEKNGIRTEAGDRRREVIARNNERKQRRLRQRIAEREMDWDLSR